MRHLPKHLRPRWRYLGVEIETWPNTRVSRGQFQRELYFSAQNLLGDAVSARMDCRLLGFDAVEGMASAVVRVRRGDVEPARAAIACIDTIGETPVRVRVRGVGGTVRSCEERYIRRPLETPEERTVAFENSEQQAFVRQQRVAVCTDSGFAGATDFDIE
ncbi:Rpp14/Pop5 family protein [Halocatena halophila]|uniref:Rpp14/Pop5 family protein n=1 Tax=Halocatena halophila TaxID=2814576 RepID=UPI002ED500CC